VVNALRALTRSSAATVATAPPNPYTDSAAVEVAAAAAAVRGNSLRRRWVVVGSGG